jgi:hypothetical protein
LKELLITLEIQHLGFFQLTLAFKSFKLPPIIMRYIDEKGAVPSERMIKLRDGLNPQKRFSDIAPFTQLSPFDFQLIKQARHDLQKGGNDMKVKTLED